MSFASLLLNWFYKHGRRDLPWQKKITPYRVWVSEIMLQQTQVKTVIPYYKHFISCFPNIKQLALANLDSILSCWSGLGYYARARNLHQTAQIICNDYRGRFPKTIHELLKLPGIGRSTAGAILSFAMNQSAAILDGNVKRVLCRYFAIAAPHNTITLKNLWARTEALTPKHNTNHYNQALMDLGANICTRTHPKCSICPLKQQCKANRIQRQTDFPIRKIKKQSPLKSVYTLLLRTENGELLLEQRPLSGIWGGLWGFPECAIDENIVEFCQKYYSVLIKEKIYWPIILHKFTHFKLEMHPVLLTIASHAMILRNAPLQLWYNVNHILPGGVSAPVKTLLAKYRDLFIV